MATRKIKESWRGVKEIRNHKRVKWLKIQAYLALLHFALSGFTDMEGCFFFFDELKVCGHPAKSDDGLQF